MSQISSSLVKKFISYPTIYSLAGIPKATTFLPPHAAIKLTTTSPEITLKNTAEHEFGISVSQEMTIMSKVPDFDPIPPEKPADPPPLSPDPAPEFPGPPKPDPEIQPPGPDMPVPPNTPGGPEVVPPEWTPPNPPDMPVPPNTPGGPVVVPSSPPEWMPPNPPDITPQHPSPPDIPQSYA